MTAPLRRDNYTRPAKPVIRFSRGATHQDPPEVSIEITGHAREEWARKVAAVDRIIDALRYMVDSFGYTDWDSVHDAARCDDARAALALLDPPTTTVDGAATGAGPENAD